MKKKKNFINFKKCFPIIIASIKLILHKIIGFAKTNKLKKAKI